MRTVAETEVRCLLGLVHQRPSVVDEAGPNSSTCIRLARVRGLGRSAKIDIDHFAREVRSLAKRALDGARFYDESEGLGEGKGGY